jgi:multidrug efflux pump subunit AcrB
MLERLVRASLGGTAPLALSAFALVAGVFALLATPREEEPQIVVPVADVLIEAPTLGAREVERLVATPLEKVLAQIDGVEHVYSVSEDGRAMVTVRFFVGEDREDSLVKLYNKIFSNQDLVPPAVTAWVVKPIEIDDVPILIATLWSETPDVDDYDLRRLAEEVALDLQTVLHTNRIDVIGGRPRQLTIDLDATAMAARNTAIGDVLFALQASNVRMPSGALQQAGRELRVETDARIGGAAALAALTINVVDGVPVRLRDIAAVHDGPAEPTAYNWIRFGPAHATPTAGNFASVDVAVAKQRGANAVRVARDLTERLDGLASALFPPGVHIEITRNYGATADQKMSDLLISLAVAVLTVVALISLVLGWRAALVVALAVPICYGFTLLLDYAAGYTINRVTLFALILALGLLVDDPITGVDNIQRHLGSSKTLLDDIAGAIMEIRMPLVMSTLAIVIAFAPMQFITGMMGPYMSPMAFNVPVAVLISTVVAFVVTPWLGKLLLRPAVAAAPPTRRGIYARLLQPLLASRKRSWWFLGALAAAFVVALTLPFLRVVPLKLLPYDNKNEFQVIIDAPEGTTLEATDAAAADIASFLTTIPEVRAVVAYSGNHSPMDFNGMVRHYYLRGAPHEGELRVTLADRFARPDQSHALVLRLRHAIERLAQGRGVIAKLVEVPPGPPVIASVVAELYGAPTTSYATLIGAARATAERLAREPGVVDVDVSAAAPHERRVFVPDQEKAAMSGISAAAIATALAVTVDGEVAGYVDAPAEAAPLPIRLQVPYAERTDLGNLQIKGLPGIVKSSSVLGISDAPTPLVSLAELGHFVDREADQPIYHKDLQRLTYAFAEVAGRTPAEVVFDVDADRNAIGHAPTAPAARTYFASGGGDAWSLPRGVRVAWSGEGEWDITLRVFRDLGIAFGVALVGLFMVIWLQTGLAALTGIIMLAIPLTAIGIMPGFALLNALTAKSIDGYADPVLFTATAMIGMIALAGIVVRNSLILIEFIEHERQRGSALQSALLRAGAMRARPVLLTAGTTLLGNMVITLDPIFSGLAWAIIFGVTASTGFTLLVVPVTYHLVYGDADA